MALILNGTTGIDFPDPIAVADGGTGLSSPGTAGHLLTSTGTAWTSSPAPISLPDQTGNSGKYLTTNGTIASWGVLDTSTVTGGTLNISGTSAAGSNLRLYENTDNGTNFVSLKAADTIASNVTWTLPATDGTNGQALTTNGSGTLSWAAAGATVTDDTSTNASYYPTLSTSASGSLTAARVSSTKLYFNPSTGTLNATVFNSLSDGVMKTNINPVMNAVDVINGIDGVEFDWKDNNTKSAGVVAQQLEKILPHLVSTSQDGMKSVNYSGITAYLIQAVKELSEKIKTLESK